MTANFRNRTRSISCPTILGSIHLSGELSSTVGSVFIDNFQALYKPQVSSFHSYVGEMLV